jgi:Na+/H+ antiporter NhaC
MVPSSSKTYSSTVLSWQALTFSIVALFRCWLGFDRAIETVKSVLCGLQQARLEFLIHIYLLSAIITMTGKKRMTMATNFVKLPVSNNPNARRSVIWLFLLGSLMDAVMGDERGRCTDWMCCFFSVD